MGKRTNFAAVMACGGALVSMLLTSCSTEEELQAFSGTVKFFADDVVAELWVNGDSIEAPDTTMYRTKAAEFPSGKNLTLGVLVDNSGGWSGALMGLIETNLGVLGLQAEDWKCTFNAPVGWASPDFDASSWGPVADFGLFD